MNTVCAYSVALRMTVSLTQKITEMEKLMTFGNKNRSVGSTAMNERSSRSHSIFSITIEASSQNEAGEDHIRVGKLHLVDLAGSERQTKTQASGDRLKEAAKINLSLSALGNVISALVDGKSSHIPYRDSKLTRLLQDSLGGNSNTLMVATVSPASYNFDESLSTLRYANRAKNIKNKPKINEDPKDAMLREFQEEILRLKAQLESGDGEVIVREVEEIHEVEEIEEVEGDEDIGVEDDETEQNLECVEEGGAKKSRKEITKASSTKATPKRRKSTKGSSSDTIDQSRLQAVKDQIEAEKAAILVKKDLEESEKNRLIQEAEKRVKDIEIERRKKEDVAKRLAQMEQKLLAGGVNLLDKNEQQKLVLAKKAQELEEKARKERDLQRQLAEKEELNLQIEEEFSTLQEAAVSKTKKLKKLWNILVTHKTEIQDLQQECQRDREALLDTIRALSKHLKHQLLILDAFIAPEEQVLIEQFAEFDDAAEKWRIPFVAHAGNNIRGKRALVSGNVIKASGRREKKNGKAQEEEDGIGQWDPMCAFSNVYLRYDLGKSKRKTSLRMSGNASVTPKSGPPRKGSPTKDSNRRSSLKGTPSDSPIPVPEPIPTARGLVGRNRHYA